MVIGSFRNFFGLANKLARISPNIVPAEQVAFAHKAGAPTYAFKSGDKPKLMALSAMMLTGGLIWAKGATDIYFQKNKAH